MNLFYQPSNVLSFLPLTASSFFLFYIYVYYFFLKKTKLFYRRVLLGLHWRIQAEQDCVSAVGFIRTVAWCEEERLVVFPRAEAEEYSNLIMHYKIGF